MFEHSRIFSDRNLSTGFIEWFCETREGLVGPFESEALAKTALQRHIEYAKQRKIDGGRGIGADHFKSLELEQR